MCRKTDTPRQIIEFVLSKRLDDIHMVRENYDSYSATHYCVCYDIYKRSDVLDDEYLIDHYEISFALIQFKCFPDTIFYHLSVNDNGAGVKKIMNYKCTKNNIIYGDTYDPDKICEVNQDNDYILLNCNDGSILDEHHSMLPL